jgi:iron complex outermembrane recepter protein
MMLCAGSIQASATRVDFNVAKQSADKALVDFARQAGLSVLFPTERINQVESNSLRGKYEVDQALAILLHDTGLTAELSATGVLTVKTTGQRENLGMQSTKAKKRLPALISLLAAALFGQSRAETTSSTPPSDDMLQEVIVSAQKREERLQDVPVSVSVLNPETLLQQNNLGATDQPLGRHHNR